MDIPQEVSEFLRRRALNDEVKQSPQPADLPKGPTQVILKGRKWSTVGIDRLSADQGSTYGFDRKHGAVLITTKLITGYR